MNILADPLHIHTGLLVFFTVCIVGRRFKSTALPLICVIVVEVALLWPGLTGSSDQRQMALASFLSAIVWPFAIVVLSRLGLLNLLSGAPPSHREGTSGNS